MDSDIEKTDFATGGESTYSLTSSSQTTKQNGETHTQPAHRRMVFTDPAAFRYLEEDPSVTVLERRRRLTGYEVYIVEQWACSRTHPTFVITTYTGLERDSVVVGVLSIPTNEEAWSPRLRVYLKAITQHHARKKETPLGDLMVTNLSGFPSAMTVIAVPDGDLRKHREDFIVNEDMKRLGCAGRTGMNLAPPTTATQAKFGQLFHTSDKIPLYNAVIELVKTCQVALLLFGKLEPEYADGLLCDITEQVIGDWWTEIGTEYFNIDPSDGILGPTTVAALLGILMGARNRLNAYGAPVAKDVFDIVNTKRAIAYFQKSQKMDRTRRFDRQTLERLHRVTAKAASVEGWTVPRAVKSSLAELKGKGGEKVLGKEKASIAEVETLDIETFIQLGNGAKFKWLWYGKEPKNKGNDAFSHLGGEEGMIFNDSEQTGHGWSGKKRDSVDDDTSLRHVLSDRIYLNSTAGSQTSIGHVEKEQGLRKAVFKNVTGKVTDTRNGLGRIRDAVGLKGHRSHYSKPSKDGGFAPYVDGGKQARTSVEEPRDPEKVAHSLQHESTPPDSGEHSLVSSKDSSRLGSVLAEDATRSHDLQGPPIFGGTHLDEFNKSSSKDSSRRGSVLAEDATRSHDLQGPPIFGGTHLDEFNKSSSSLESPAIYREPKAVPDYASMMDQADGVRPRNEGREPTTTEDSSKGALSVEDTQAIKKMQGFEGHYKSSHPLRTTKSLPKLSAANLTYWDRRWPRHMSWTAMVDVVAAAVPAGMTESDSTAPRAKADTALACEKSLALEGRVMAGRIEKLKAVETSWVEDKIDQIERYDHQAGQDSARLDLVYHQKFDEINALHDASDELLTEERANLADANKDVETLAAKLEYELSALESKVEDVENGVADFERLVRQIEVRAEDLDADSEARVTWLGWSLRKVNRGVIRF